MPGVKVQAQNRPEKILHFWLRMILITEIVYRKKKKQQQQQKEQNPAKPEVEEISDFQS